MVLVSSEIDFNGIVTWIAGSFQKKRHMWGLRIGRFVSSGSVSLFD